MKLNIPERYLLTNILPEKGNFATMNVKQELKNLLYPNSKEVIEYEITVDGNDIRWNRKGTEQVEIPLTEAHVNLFIAQIEKLSEQELIDDNYYYLNKRLQDEKDGVNPVEAEIVEEVENVKPIKKQNK